MNCAIPCAPAGDRAKGLKFDSAMSCAASSPAETFQRCAACASGRAYAAGTNDGSERAVSPSPPLGFVVNPTEVVPALRVNP